MRVWVRFLVKRRSRWSVLTKPYTSQQRFGTYLCGAVCGSTGIWFFGVAFGIRAFQLTGGSTAVALVSVSQFAPAILLFPVVGRTADRFDKRRLMCVTQAGLAMTALSGAALSFRDALTVPVLLALAMTVGVLQSFQSPAMLALVPNLVAPARRATALAVNSVQFNIARVIGPGLAAVLVTTVGIGAGMLINCVLFLAFIAALSRVRPTIARPVRECEAPTAESGVAKDSRILLALLLGGAASAAGELTNTLAPALGSARWGDESGAGLLVAGFGFGAVLFVVVLQPIVSAGWRSYMSLALVIEAAGLAAYAMASTAELTLVGSIFCGVGFLAASTKALTALQATTHIASLGRMMAVWLAVFVGIRPVAAVSAGWASDQIGLRGTCLAAAAILVGVALVAGRHPLTTSQAKGREGSVAGHEVHHH